MDSNGMDGSSEAESDLNGLNERQGEREEDEMEDGDLGPRAPGPFFPI
jgi:hypothetical protein